MSVRVRMAPSPTGFLHIGGVRTFLFNWLFARGRGGECLLRIENTDTSREVAESVEQIERSLRWLGIDWDGETTFQLDRIERCQEEARRLVADGAAYEDEGAIRFRMPNEGVTAWDDAVKGRIEFPNEQLEDVVLVRGDGRPTYNFASPVEDWLDGITHVIRGDDHVSNTPKQILILQALGAELPTYAHVPNVFGEDGKKLSKRHGAVSVDEFRAAGYIAPALMNFLALLGWAPDGETTIMSRDELIERFTLERVGASPATFDYAKLDWMNGVYLRALSPEEYAESLLEYLREQGYDWDEQRVRAAVPLVQEKIAKLGEFPDFAGFLFHDVEPDPALLDPDILSAAAEALSTVEPFTAEQIETALKELCDRLGLKPRQAFQPIRVAVTGSKISPGLYESLELLGRDESLARLRARRQRLERRERIERPLKLQPRTATVARARRGNPDFVLSDLLSALFVLPSIPHFQLLNVLRSGSGTGNVATVAGVMRGEGGRTHVKTVLVVDDERSLRLLCRVNLELEGHVVHEAGTLAEARKLIEQESPDVILLDVHLGSEDGLELLDEVEALDLPVRIVLLSGTSEVGPELRSRVAGVLGKPFELPTARGRRRRLDRRDRLEAMSVTAVRTPAEYEDRLARYLFERSEEGRAVRVGEKETSEQAAIVERYRDLFSTSQLDVLREAEESAGGDERELLYRLRKTCESGILAAELAAREDELENRILAARVDWRGEELPLRTAQAKLAVLPGVRRPRRTGLARELRERALQRRPPGAARRGRGARGRALG